MFRTYSLSKLLHVKGGGGGRQLVTQRGESWAMVKDVRNVVEI